MEQQSGADVPLSFEEALQRLESIVESLEDGENSLKDLVENYRQGVSLLKHCQKQLQAVELTIKQLDIDHSNENEQTTP